MGAARAVGDRPLFDERGDATAYGFGGEPQKFGRFDQFERHKKFAAAVAVAAIVVVVALPRQNPQQRGDFFFGVDGAQQSGVVARTRERIEAVLQKILKQFGMIRKSRRQIGALEAAGLAAGQRRNAVFGAVDGADQIGRESDGRYCVGAIGGRHFENAGAQIDDEGFAAVGEKPRARRNNQVRAAQMNAANILRRKPAERGRVISEASPTTRRAAILNIRAARDDLGSDFHWAVVWANLITANEAVGARFSVIFSACGRLQRNDYNRAMRRVYGHGADRQAVAR